MVTYQEILNKKLDPIIALLKDEDKVLAEELKASIDNGIIYTKNENVFYASIALAQEQLYFLRKKTDEQARNDIKENISLLMVANDLSVLTLEAVSDSSVSAVQSTAEKLTAHIKRLQDKAEQVRLDTSKQYDRNRDHWNGMAYGLLGVLGLALFVIAITVFAAPIMAGAVTFATAGAVCYAMIAGFGVSFSAGMFCMTAPAFEIKKLNKLMEKGGKVLSDLDARRQLHFNNEYQATRRLTLFAEKQREHVSDQPIVKKVL